MLLATTVLLLAAAPRAGEWRELFDGHDLAGWVERGGKARWSIELTAEPEGAPAIVGESVPGEPNGFLCTEATFGDFELQLEFRVDPPLNSGVQLRSAVAADGRVGGLQFEIDMDPARDRFWSGGLYDEAGRGWLDPGDGEQGARGAAFSAQGREIGRFDEWNSLRVVASGPEVTTWLDGELRASIVDPGSPRGFVALQVHGVGDDPAKAGRRVRFRRIRLRELPPPEPLNALTEQERAEGWRLLFDGATGDGWRSARGDSFPTTGWSIRDGALHVAPTTGGESSGGGDLITRERFGDFELLVDFRLTPGANSGIKYFVQPDLRPIDASGRPAATGSAIGCELQLLDDARHPDAKLGRDGNRTLASLYDLIAAPSDKPARAIGEWNRARVVARGTHVEHWLNGAKVVEYERGSPAFRELVAASKYKNLPGFGEWADGHVLLQDHGDAVSFRNVKIRVLPAKER